MRSGLFPASPLHHLHPNERPKLWPKHRMRHRPLCARNRACRLYLLIWFGVAMHPSEPTLLWPARPVSYWETFSHNWESACLFLWIGTILLSTLEHNYKRQFVHCLFLLSISIHNAKHNFFCYFKHCFSSLIWKVYYISPVWGNECV